MEWMGNINKNNDMKEYIPEFFDTPRCHKVDTAWGHLPTIIKDIIVRFNLKQERAFDFGTATGYSASALANYFKEVGTIDTFRGDSGTLDEDDPCNSYHVVKKSLHDAGFNNLTVHCGLFEDYIKTDNSHYNLIHVDIIHTYEPTFQCGEWSILHSDCVIFHDTMAFPPVMQAVSDLAEKYKLQFYNYPECWGLGILIK